MSFYVSAGVTAPLLWTTQLCVAAAVQAVAIITWKVWFMVELATAMQHARALVTAAPHCWDPVLIGRIICEAPMHLETELLS
jgi:hypothetical protein